MKSIYRLRKRITILFILFFLVVYTGCTKLVDVQAPTTSLSQENVYTTDAAAISVLTNIYANMSAQNPDLYISELCGLSADEFSLWNGAPTDDEHYHYYTNSLSANLSDLSAAVTDFWQIYGGQQIYACNAAIEGITASNSLTPSVKQQLLGEAKFMRAFFYFYLVNLFGDVPLVLSTNWQTNSILSRAPKATVYNQIITDLKDAQGLLSANYLDAALQPYNANPERVRPIQAAATAMLARVYLYTGDNADAVNQCTAVINNSSNFSLAGLNNVFFANSTEAIWQLQPVVAGHNTEDGWYFIIPSTGFDGANWLVYLNPDLVNSFEPGDQRRVNWVDSIILAPDTFYYPYKYKSATLNAPVTEYEMVLRLGEQYLIRAEAEANLGDLGDAQTDLNAIRTRAGLPGTTANDQSSLLTAILHERQVELFTEWGHRWLDLKRTGGIDVVMKVVTPQKASGASWQSYQQLYPIPFLDIQADPNLTQNAGY